VQELAQHALLATANPGGRACVAGSVDRVRHVLPAIWFAGFQISKEQSAGFDILWTPPA
jgi:hypothetical protein